MMLPGHTGFDEGGGRAEDRLRLCLAVSAKAGPSERSNQANNAGSKGTMAARPIPFGVGAHGDSISRAPFARRPPWCGRAWRVHRPLGLAATRCLLILAGRGDWQHRARMPSTTMRAPEWLRPEPTRTEGSDRGIANRRATWLDNHCCRSVGNAASDPERTACRVSAQKTRRH